MSVQEINNKQTTEEKVQAVLLGLESGKTREELAVELCYKDWRGLDMLMRRQGYVLRDGIYVLASKIDHQNVTELLPQPIRMTLEQLKKGNKDLQAIAGMVGFRNRIDLASYMKAQGWSWDSQRETYIRIEGGATDNGNAHIGTEDEFEDNSNPPFQPDMNPQRDSDWKEYLPLLKYLSKHQTHLDKLFNQSEDQGTIPRYKLSGGVTVTKSVSMGSTLDQLIRDFSQETGVSQRIVFETALIQFLIKYGYSSQVNALLIRG